IPASDIAKVLYDDEFNDPDNLFLTYINNTNDREIENFLYTAKKLERKRNEVASPWYYPESRYGTTGEFTEIIESCKAYQGSRLKDRYALQLIRALFAARDYAGCVESYDEYFRDFPESNLLKRMAMKYVAGCWSRLGDVDKANRFFAGSGDFQSIVHPDAVAYMAERNPDCPELMAHIQHCSTDSARFCAIKPVAQKVLRGKKAHYRGDWEFFLAYEAGEFHSDYATASLHIARAMQSQFSSSDFRDHARAYRMKVDAALGRCGSLLSELRWIEGKVNTMAVDATEWNRMLRNIVYMNWVPTLWRQKDFATAILLCGYADNLFATKQRHTYLPLDDTRYPYLETKLLSLTLDETRNNTDYPNPIDYSNPSFRLMNTLTSSQLIAVKQALAAGSPLYRHLKLYARTDAPYIDEIIGTLALREERYALAANYLARVPLNYLATTNIYKEGNMKVSPFSAFPRHWHDFDSIPSPLRAKYHFACRMLHYQKLMHHGKTPDERGMARLKYAIARRNSFEDCWWLTQYWRGTALSLFQPWIDNFFYGDIMPGFPELYDYEITVGCDATEAVFNREVKAALAMLTTDAARAEAEYLLFHLKTIVARYPGTPTAHAVKSSCDRWRLWL
ncbi:MAG: tol-pal system YbgF family protein, partial [Muribaculaceae bacterium]